MTNGIHVELAMSACDRCPVATLSSTTPVEEMRVDSAEDRVEFVAADPPADPPTGLDLVEFGGLAHGRYEIACEGPDTDGRRAKNDADSDESRAAGDAGLDGGRAKNAEATDAIRKIDDTATDGGGVVVAPDSNSVVKATPDAESRTGESGSSQSTETETEGVCAGCTCGGLPAAFANFPVSPRRTEMVDGEIQVSFVLSGHEELQAIVDECEASGLDVELRRLCVDRGNGGEGDCRPDVVPVDLGGVTDRQVEIATVAAEKGYFETGGASAADVAAEFDLAKSTVSEHLRAVTRSLFSQAFGDGDRT